MKNKKGFTLVELLVTIALMLSILAIAIVSFIGISNKKKQESYNLVKEQIITAAEQYFDSNEYLFEGLVDGSYGIISVGKLVNEDYLNKVTNPVTGKLVNYCSQVEVKKENGRYVSSFKEYEENDECDSNYSVTIKEPGSPSIELSFYEQSYVNKEITVSNDDEWFNIKKLGENGKLGVKVTGNTQNNGKITEISKCSMDGKVSCTNYNHVKNDSSFEDNDTFSSETNEKTVCYKVTNISGKSASKCVTAKVDTVKPTCSANIAGGIVGNNGWYKGKTAPTVTFSATDNLSGMSDNYKNDKKALPVNEGENKTYSKKYADVAGNTCTISKTVSYDGTNPTCRVSIDGTNKNGDIYKNAGWYTSTVTLTGKCSDSNSGCTENVSKSFENEKVKTSETPGIVYDKAGNTTTCDTKTFGIDWTVPIVVDKGAGYVYCDNGTGSQNAHGFSIKYKDNLSTSNVYMTKYCNGSECSENSKLVDSNSDNNIYTIHTVFTGYYKRVSEMWYNIIDEAGNSSSVYLKAPSRNSAKIWDGITHNSNGYCNESLWYNDKYNTGIK